MTESRRYKAFISYSHKDERWAKWLQRALERYRVPRRLVGQATDQGAVPARLRPVFRDREDLSSASDLTGRIKQELAASDALIVVCSPAAAQSRWVSEEVRYFRELGRADRILALVVDGDPETSGDRGCFPAQLLESGDGEQREPLAADARRYADGKHLALLKIVAGLLDVRLDELRRRDAQRRLRRRLVNTAVFLAVALVIAWLVHSAQSSRETVRMQRSNTEEYLAFMLGNLDRLDPMLGLETTAPHEGEREPVDVELGLTDLADEVLLERGRKWREVGLELMGDSELDSAMREFFRSRAALSELYQRDRGSEIALYELGQTEFYVGMVHVRRAEIDEAQWHWYRYGVLTRRLVNADPYNPEYVMELAYTLNNIGAVEQQKPMPDYAASLDRLNQAIQFNRLALGLDPENPVYERDLTTLIEWAADAHMGLCSLGEALEFRQQSTTRRRQLLERNPSFEDRLQLAYALSGLAWVKESIGLFDAARNDYAESVEILGSLRAENPDDVNLLWDLVYREIRFARLLDVTGNPAQAAEIILRHAPRVDELASGGLDSDKFFAVDATLYELDLAQVLFDRQETARGEERLRSAVARVAELVAERPNYRQGRQALVDAYFAYWEHFGSSPGENFDRLIEQYPVTSEAVQSCDNADLGARLAVSRGDTGVAQRFVDYALDKGYYAPAFIGFCRRYGLCEAP